MDRTFLTLVNDVLDALSLDRVTDIYETVESTQLVGLIDQLYHEFVTEREWPWCRRVRTLEALTDKRFFRIPDNWMKIVELQYNEGLAKSSGSTDVYSSYKTLKYLPPEEFLAYVNSRKVTDNLELVSGVVGEVPTVTALVPNLILGTNAHPSYWTSFTDREIVVDSYYDNPDLAVGEYAALFQSVVYVIPEILPVVVVPCDCPPAGGTGPVTVVVTTLTPDWDAANTRWIITYDISNSTGNIDNYLVKLDHLYPADLTSTTPTGVFYLPASYTSGAPGYSVDLYIALCVSNADGIDSYSTYAPLSLPI